jgi:hypothetical protein
VFRNLPFASIQLRQPVDNFLDGREVLSAAATARHRGLGALLLQTQLFEGFVDLVETRRHE